MYTKCQFKIGSFSSKKKTVMFPLSDLFSQTQEKLEKNFECGTFAKRLVGKIGAFAIIPNGPQITQTFSWYSQKKIQNKTLNVGHWTFECDEKYDLELGSYNVCTGN